jgi:lipopolysaccharide/colanic/teichoic acid biosynthesis glycosyltransferase
MSRFCSGATETKDKQMLKRFFDIFFSALGLILLTPLLALLAIAIKKSSSGPVLYRGIGVGRGESCSECSSSVRWSLMPKHWEARAPATTTSGSRRLGAG